MDQLFNLQFWKFNGRERYYQKVFAKALSLTGPITLSPIDDKHSAVYSNGPARVLNHGGYSISITRTARSVLIPDSILPHIRPENRGDDFPSGIPFVELK